MKRLLLAAATLLGAYGTTTANTMTVHNLTPCTYTLSTSAGTLLVVGPGTYTFTSSPDFVATKIVYNYGLPGSISIGVGIPPGFPPYANSSAYSPGPACLTSSSFYTCSWAQSTPTADATLVIF
ncbi:hypothetical protein [Taibaiella chishuiensis]|uniref:Uncharacterized protein n=1 Tax=Taibaiella chishuiensis TaxID=1434707 RepID=A0A2P8DDB5_9BACT|nr:hypothetical protein [Taibaiella chishuiensis]PSK95221.1 hypothetical protein B0I18_1011387 [Taibaiella chishuiensis]